MYPDIVGIVIVLISISVHEIFGVLQSQSILLAAVHLHARSHLPTRRQVRCQASPQELSTLDVETASRFISTRIHPPSGIIEERVREGEKRPDAAV